MGWDHANLNAPRPGRASRKSLRDRAWSPCMAGPGSMFYTGTADWRFHGRGEGQAVSHPGDRQWRYRHRQVDDAAEALAQLGRGRGDDRARLPTASRGSRRRWPSSWPSAPPASAGPLRSSSKSTILLAHYRRDAHGAYRGASRACASPASTSSWYSHGLLRVRRVPRRGEPLPRRADAVEALIHRLLRSSSSNAARPDALAA